MKTTLAPILSTLDEGLQLYRRAFVTFAALAAIGALPALGFFFGGALLSALVEPFLGTLLSFAGLILGVPALIYAFGAISRAALELRATGRASIGRSLAIRPLRALGIGCYGSALMMVLNMVASMVSLLCICPLYIAVAGSVGVVAAGVSSTGGVGAGVSALVIMVGAIALLAVYLISIAFSGAAYCAAVFGLQPLVHEQGRAGALIQRSIDLITHRFGRNLLAFICASLVFGAISVATTLAVGMLAPLPLLIALGGESPLAQGAAGVAWMIGVVLAAPPLPIWMALLYERRTADSSGGDLGERIAALAEPAPGL